MWNLPLTEHSGTNSFFTERDRSQTIHEQRTHKIVALQLFWVSGEFVISSLKIHPFCKPKIHSCAVKERTHNEWFFLSSYSWHHMRYNVFLSRRTWFIVLVRSINSCRPPGGSQMLELSIWRQSHLTTAVVKDIGRNVKCTICRDEKLA